MPISYQYDSTTRILHVLPNGVVTIADIAAYADAALADKEVASGYVEVVYFDKVTEFAISYEASTALRDIFLRCIDKKSYIGSVLIGASNYHYGMARMFEMLAEDLLSEVRVFRESAEAMAWFQSTPAPAR